MEILAPALFWTANFETLYAGLAELLKDLAPSSVYVLTDQNTAKFCYPEIAAYLQPHLPIIVQAGEPEKTITTAAVIWESLLNSGADRKAIMINLGGGMVGDLGGFAASTYMRGIRFINIPTTSLAMIDASVGGKTAVNFKHTKNLIGSFQLPEAVLVCPAWLKTQPLEDQIAGGFELIKAYLLEGNPAIGHIAANPLAKSWLTDHSIKHSILFKHSIVTKDFTEQAERTLLNLGHTIGHAIEAYLNADQQVIPHGFAVGLGMVVELKLAVQHHLLDEAVFKLYQQIASRLIPATYWALAMTVPQQELISLVVKDKKNQHGNINFSMPTLEVAYKSGRFSYQPEVGQMIEAYYQVLKTE